MFFKLRVTGENCKPVSYIIVKNPSSIFERDVKNRGKIIAKFDRYKDNEVIYSGYIENNSLSFIKTCKNENLPNYVNSEQYSVCPFNLIGLDLVFRSALRGTNIEGITQEQHNTKYNIEFTLGPFSLFKRDFLIEMFESIDCYTVEIIEDGIAYALKVSGYDNITNFLQKIYVISFAMTNHLRFLAPSKEGIDKLVNLSKNWINDHPRRNLIINKLSKIKRNVKTFEEELLINDNVNEKEAKEKAQSIIDSFKIKHSELRYQGIINLINKNSSVLDLGCNTGNLIQRLLSERDDIKKLIGFDCNIKVLDIANKRAKKILKKDKNRDIDFKIINGSIYYPNYEIFSGLDTVIMSEIIEHFPKEALNIILDVVFKGIFPETVILTTPNKDFNKNLKLKDGELRHLDHKFEFTVEEVKEFAKLIEYNYKYSYEFYSFIDKEENKEYDKFDQLSFIIKFQKQEEAKPNNKIQEKSKIIYSPFNLDISGYSINKKQINIGSASVVRKIDPAWIVSLAPTMSPADCSNIEGYLEHPSESIGYYLDRKIYDLICETKYMGSRGTIVATKNSDVSKCLFNCEDKIKIYSRNGYDFFNESFILDEIWDELYVYMNNRESDIIVIDSEILPWSYKAKSLIEKQFQKPGDCALMDKKITGRDSTKEELFLKSLSNYNRNSNIEIYPFNTILEANLYKNGKRLINVKNGNYIKHALQLFELDKLCENSKYFKKVNYEVLHLCPPLIGVGSTNTFAIERIIKFWKDLENKGLEGIVIKPNYPTQFLKDGRLIQPAIKCRCREYLRLIYGIDYLEDENLKFLKNRRAAAKRKLAMQQFELSQKILYSFINRNIDLQLRNIFGFFGMESVNRVDATL